MNPINISADEKVLNDVLIQQMAQAMGELDKILKDDTARKLFLKKNSDDAIRYLGVDIQELVKLATLPNLCKGLTALATSELRMDDLHLIRSNRENIDAIYVCIYTLQNFVENELADQ